MDNNNAINESIPIGTTPSKAPRRAMITIVIILTIIISSAFGALFGFMAGTVGQEFFSTKLGLKTAAPKTPEVSTQRLIQEDSTVIDVVDMTTPAVVSIIATQDVPKLRDFFDDPFGFPDLFGGTPGEQQRVSSGTGFIITGDGMIVTNKHVVSNERANYTVITNDNKEHPATVLARDPLNDIAVMKIEGNDFPVLKISDANDFNIGQTVIAIGNSLGEFSNTVSKGIVSGLQRNLTAGSSFGESERLSNIIQTDAAINPGNSGGPLIDLNGEAIGINVAVAQGAENIGFAIPANQIRRVVDQVQTTGKITVPYIGVRYVLIDKTIQMENNLPVDYGALVIRGQRVQDLAVIPGSPADKAGIVENDIILEINGARVDAKNGLTDLISQQSVGQEVTLKVWHRGEEREVKLILEERK